MSCQELEAHLGLFLLFFIFFFAIFLVFFNSNKKEKLVFNRCHCIKIALTWSFFIKIIISGLAFYVSVCSDCRYFEIKNIRVEHWIIVDILDKVIIEVLHRRKIVMMRWIIWIEVAIVVLHFWVKGHVFHLVSVLIVRVGIVMAVRQHIVTIVLLIMVIQILVPAIVIITPILVIW